MTLSNVLQFLVWIFYICCAKVIHKYFMFNHALVSENFKIIFPILVLTCKKNTYVCMLTLYPAPLLN